MDAGDLVPILAILFIGLHYITKWKTAPTMTNDDEQMLGDMHELARRLEDRLETAERLIAQDNPEWNPRRIDHESDDYRAENIRKLERNR
jgi:phage shock protein B